MVFLNSWRSSPRSDGVDVDPDHLHPVLLEDPLMGQGRGEVEAGLAAQIRQQRVRALLGDDLGEIRRVQRFDVGDVRHGGVGHDRRRVRVDQDDLVAEFLAGPCTPAFPSSRTRTPGR